MANVDQLLGKRRRQLLVDEETQWLRRADNAMVCRASGISQCGRDVGILQIGKVLKNFGAGRAGSHRLDDIRHAHSRALDARAPTANRGVDDDSFVKVLGAG